MAGRCLTEVRESIWKGERWPFAPAILRSYPWDCNVCQFLLERNVADWSTRSVLPYIHRDTEKDLPAISRGRCRDDAWPISWKEKRKNELKLFRKLVAQAHTVSAELLHFLPYFSSSDSDINFFWVLSYISSLWWRRCWLIHKMMIDEFWSRQRGHIFISLGRWMSPFHSDGTLRRKIETTMVKYLCQGYIRSMGEEEEGWFKSGINAGAVPEQDGTFFRKQNKKGSNYFLFVLNFKTAQKRPVSK